MIQFYLLSVLLNLLCGALLVSRSGTVALPLAQRPSPILEHCGKKKFIGILTILVGAQKLFYSLHGDLPFIGDLVPALGGILSGAAYLAGVHGTRKKEGRTAQGVFFRLRAWLSARRSFFGYFGMLSAVFHFLFPRVLFL
jgi:hypothetical protein